MTRTTRRSLARRLAALSLALVMLLGLCPIVSAEAEAAHWGQAYLDQLIAWGVMRDDIADSIHPDRPVTRAEFVTMINRAHGYDKPGEHPFTDIESGDWYYDDIVTAYNMGYFLGMTPTTASPNSYLTREQAVVIFARTMVMEQRTGEALGYSDSRELGDWSRGYIESVTEAGIVGGYDDGTFRPGRHISRAEVAAMLVRAVGTLIQDPGVHTLGSVYGNVTISSSGVTLRNTVIAGDLYLTGGIDLGSVMLENVTVLGKIVACGGGESHEGGSSIILRNVTANEMVVDSIASQFVTIQADGATNITSTLVRTSAHLADLTTSGPGLASIALEAEEGASLYLEGGINTVTNYTPGSSVYLAQGSAAKITVDEKAVDSYLRLEGNTYAMEVNLDVGTTVAGSGDISHLNVNAAGTSTSMLPDTIYVRPGITGTIAGEVMDTTIAAESSQDPRMLTSYPEVRNVAPTSAQAVFSGNKSGTIYWALTAVSDGSVSEEDLISPPAYGSTILQSGTVRLGSSKTEFTADLSKLDPDGNYYLSAIMEDSRGQRSPVKVTAFSTPDNTVPDFTTGYPYMSAITNNSAQVAVMANKSCVLYYALLPKGATAPTPNEFKANAVSGNLGYGTRMLTKNVADVFYVNGQTLEELKEYELFLWLTDADGAQSSSVEKLGFTTVDGTPPEIVTGPLMTEQKETSVKFAVTLNEKGTFYWVVVEAGTEYPQPLAGQTGQVALDSDVAKLQVVNGLNAFKNGKLSMTANREGTINITNLAKETAYELYYVAVDDAGNYSRTVQKLEFTTLDVNAPVATLEFTDFNASDPTRPLADSDIRIVFNEKVQTESGVFLNELYDAVLAASAGSTDRANAQRELGIVLDQIITFYDLTEGDEEEIPTRSYNLSDQPMGTDWVVDYRKAQVVLEDGNTVIILSHDEFALNMSSGSTYRIDLRGLMDASRNQMGRVELPRFTTVFAQANLKATDSKTIAVTTTDPTTGAQNTENVTSHMGFTMEPMSTNVTSEIRWDMLLWTDTTLSFRLFSRVLDGNGNPKSPADGGDWVELTGGGEGIYINIAAGSESPIGVSLWKEIQKTTFPLLSSLSDDNTIYEYAISITKLGNQEFEVDWNATINMKVSVVVGSSIDLGNLNVTPSGWDSAVAAGFINSIGNVVATGDDELTLRRLFSDQRAPSFIDDTPSFDTSKIDDSSAVVTFKLDREGTVYYEFAPWTVVTPKDSSGNIDWRDIPGDGSGTVNGDGYSNGYTYGTGTTAHTVDIKDIVLPDPNDPSVPYFTLTSPTVYQITSGSDANKQRVIWGTQDVGTTAEELTISGLEADTQYVGYFVVRSPSNVYSQTVYYVAFKTQPVITPVIELSINNPSVNILTDRNAKVDGLLILEDQGFISGTILNTVLYRPDDTSTTNVDETIDNLTSDQTLRNYFISNYGNDEITYLEAMWTDVAENNKSIGSLFDIYASQAAKDQVANFIRSQTSGTDTIAYKMPTKTIPAGGTHTEDLEDYMSGVGRYIFLAVGQNAQGTSGNAFRAIRPLFNPDKTPPMVTDVGGGMTYDATKKTYSGTLSIVFSEPIYLRKSGTSTTLENIIPVTRKESLTSGVTNTSEVAVGTILWPTSSMGTLKIVNTQTDSTPMTSLILKLENFVAGDQVIIDSTLLCDAQGNVNPSQVVLTLKVETIQTGDTTTQQAYFKVNTAWDATGN